VLWVALFFAVIQVAENNLLAPRISGKAVGLHPAVAVLALLIGAEIGGIWGALFAVPTVGLQHPAVGDLEERGRPGR
jgi:predicted PurR-regulated permease PerM